MMTGIWVAALVSCYDGDTCRFDVDVWLDVSVHTQVRVRGIDAPEIRGQCDAEKALAVVAREFLTAQITNANQVQVRDIEPDKYGGRVVADILVDGTSVAELLVAQGLARPYDGGARQPWC